MQKTSYYLINAITLYRLISAPLLVLLLVFPRPDIFKWLIALSFFTDSIDGWLARKFKIDSAAGAKLDSIADDLTILVALAGLFVFKTEFIKEQLVTIFILLSLLVIQTVYALFKYRKPSSFHTYLAKIAAILQGSFMILAFFMPEPLSILFYTAALVTGIELIEEICITYFLPVWETNVKGLHWVLKRNQKKSL
jgi:CDP-diacylglycerol--glycerol-3-phosphate 3-phosphatidyltransferase